MRMNSANQRMNVAEPVAPGRERPDLTLLCPMASAEHADDQKPAVPEGDDQKTSIEKVVVPPTQPGGSGTGSQPEKKSA